MKSSEEIRAEYVRRFGLVPGTDKWANIMTKVRIRQASAERPWPRWQFVSFAGPNNRESRGVVDFIAIRKDHTSIRAGIKKGDPFQIYLIQVKGGGAAKPTAEDAARLRIVAKQHGACGVLYARWKEGGAATFFSLLPQSLADASDWVSVQDLGVIFGKNPEFTKWL